MRLWKGIFPHITISEKPGASAVTRPHSFQFLQEFFRRQQHGSGNGHQMVKQGPYYSFTFTALLPELALGFSCFTN